MEFYQVHYSTGGEYEEVSQLYKNKENAEKYIEEMGFTKISSSNGDVDWVQQSDSDDAPFWAEIFVVKVLDY